MSRPSILDYASLAAVQTAKLGARRFAGSKTAGFYDNHFQGRHLELFRRDVRIALRRREVVSVLSALASDATVVDVGCGVGDILRDAPQSMRRVGVDISVNSLSLAARDNPGVRFVCASAYRLPFANESVDAIVCLEVVEHLEDDVSALRELGRVLKRNGYLIISVPSTHYFPSYCPLMGHYRHYTSEQLRALCASGGLRTVRYLNGFPALHQTHMFAYGALRLVAVGLTLLWRGYVSPYELRLPLARRPLYDTMGPVFTWLAERDSRAMMRGHRGTFAVCRRIDNSHGARELSVSSQMHEPREVRSGG